MSTPEPRTYCACGQAGIRVELVGPVRMKTERLRDGTFGLVAHESGRWFCDEHWPHGESTIMRIESAR